MISSQMGSSARAGSNAPIYRATKAAATNLARSMALELADDGIAVGAYHPGWVQTDMGEGRGGHHRRGERSRAVAAVLPFCGRRQAACSKYQGEEMPF